MANYVYWIGKDGNLWVNQDGQTSNLGTPVQYKNGTAQGANGTMSGRGQWIEDPVNGGWNTDKIVPKAPSFTYNQAENPTEETTTRITGGSGSTYNAEEEAMKSRMRGIYDRQISDINDNINSLEGQLKNTLAGVDDEYNRYKNEQQSAYDAQKNDHDTKVLQNMQNLTTNRNKITDNASAGLRGLLKILGAMGAGDSSVARYNVPDMVMRQANNEISSADKVYRENEQNEDTAWGNYQNQFENDKKKLEDWYTGQVKAKKQENYEKGQSLLTDLVTALGNRAQYGGDYGNSVNDAYNRIKGYRDKINKLGEFTPTKYTGITATYKAPDLASYDTGDAKLSTTVTDSGTGASSPLLVALQGLNKKKNNNPYANNTEA